MNEEEELRCIHFSTKNLIYQEKLVFCGGDLNYFTQNDYFVFMENLGHYKPKGLFKYCKNCLETDTYKQALIMYELTH